MERDLSWALAGGSRCAVVVATVKGLGPRVQGGEGE